jgi:hypothetical protein
MAKGPLFQHRHYKAIAALIAKEDADNGYGDVMRIPFANMFEDDNPRFDRARFLAAANGKPSNGRDKVK